MRGKRGAEANFTINFTDSEAVARDVSKIVSDYPLLA